MCPMSPIRRCLAHESTAHPEASLLTRRHKLSEGIGGKAAAWRAAHVAAVEKPLPVQFAGPGGGRASNEVLAMTSPNLVGAFSQVRRCRLRARVSAGRPVCMHA